LKLQTAEVQNFERGAKTAKEITEEGSRRRKRKTIYDNRKV